MGQDNAPIRKTENEPSPILAGGIAVGLALGFPLGVTVTIGWEYFAGGSLLSDPFELVGVFAAFAALTSSLLAFLALNEQRKSRQAGTDPVLIAHFSQRPDARELIMLTISNVGAGAAMNVDMAVEASFDPAEYRILTNVFARRHPFRTIIHGQNVSFNLGMGFNLLGDTPLPPFTVNLRYEDINGSRYTGSFSLNIRELEKLGAEKSVQTRLAVATEEISKSLKSSRTQIESLVVELSKVKDTWVQEEKLPSAEVKKGNKDADI